jgi:hypothetical protein
VALGTMVATKSPLERSSVAINIAPSFLGASRL